MKSLISLFIILSLLSACGAKKEAGDTATTTNNEQPVQPIQQPLGGGASDVQGNPDFGQQKDFKRATESKDVFATMEKTPCYGTCPIYKLMILKTGKAFYQGIDHVERIGKFETTFSKAEMDMILKKADEIGFWELADEYDSPVTDFPTTITSLRKGNKTKVIANRVGGPSELRAYENFLEKLLRERDFVKLEEKEISE
jgi:hypothetical protein